MTVEESGCYGVSATLTLSVAWAIASKGRAESAGQGDIRLASLSRIVGTGFDATAARG